MLCSKGQTVRLTAETNAPLGTRADHGVAKVVSLTYLDFAPEGERGVQLDRELAGHCWWSEWQLEAAPRGFSPLDGDPQP